MSAPPDRLPPQQGPAPSRDANGAARRPRGALATMLPVSLKAYLGHVAVKLATLTVGAAFVSPAGRRLRRSLDRAESTVQPRSRAALVAHVFYPELLPEILDCFACFPPGSGLVATAPADRAAAVERMLAGVENARVVPADNRGRDIAPFVSVLNQGLLDDYDAVLKLHTKKSPHLRDGDIRRRLLFDRLAGSRRGVADIVRLFDDPRTGLVGWRMAWRHSPLFWMANRSRVEDLTKRMGLVPADTPRFFEGSMFWVRPAALAALRALDLDVEDFESEGGQLDGTLHHAMERVFDAVVDGAGQASLDLKGRPLR